MWQLMGVLNVGLVLIDERRFIRDSHSWALLVKGLKTFSLRRP
jgi:hypothetical protein